LWAAAAAAAWAGPPYLTDDPQPTDTGHWEIYNFVIGTHDPAGLAGEAGFDLNYGAAKDLQLTAVLPVAFAGEDGFSAKGLSAGTGIVELAVKYKVLHADDKSWLPDVALFPRLFVPTTARFGTGRVNLFLPLWAEKDVGPWQFFGGGGWQINPGPGQRDFWQGGIAANRTLSERLQVGAELYAQTRSAITGGPAYVAVDAAATLALVKHWSLLASAGPSWESDGRQGQVFYLALKADY
jgi:hypothetical protein